MIKLIKSTFYKEALVKRQLSSFIKESSQLSFGSECIKFESNFSHWQKRKDCIFVNSGSSANLAIIQALLNLGKIKPGDKVGFSAITWSTNVMPLIQLGLEPIPIDVELDTLNVSSRELEKVISTHKLSMLFLTNLLGFCDDIDTIQRLCTENKIILIEDNCESLGTRYRKKLLGNFGLASTFSFYVGHHLSTIEGGAICTDNTELSQMLRLVRAHGWDRNLDFISQTQIRTKFKINSTFYSRYTFYDLGYNLRPTEIAGFIGNTQLQHLTETTKKRQDNFLFLAHRIYEKTDLYFPIRYSHLDFFSNFAVPVICKTSRIRDEIVKRCDDILEIRPIVGGDISSQPFFSKYKGSRTIATPHASLIHKQGFYFGNNPEMTTQEMNQITALLTQ